MSDLKEYGSNELRGANYYVREFLGTPGGLVPAMQPGVYFINDLGGRQKVATGSKDWTPEEIAALPTLDEATAVHLELAFAEAEKNRQKWLKRQKDAPPAPAPEPQDPATQRFLDSDDEPGFDMNV